MFLSDAGGVRPNAVPAQLYKHTAVSHTLLAGISSVVAATRYGLNGPGSNPGGGEIFRSRPDWPWGPASLLYNMHRVNPGDKAAGTWR